MEAQASAFDLDGWVAAYSGILLPYRLLFIVRNHPPLAQQAVSLAVDACKKGSNVQLYRTILDSANAMNQSSPSLDTAWVAKQEDANRRELARLEAELRGYKNNLIRESIRMGQEDLAMHLLATGGPLLDPENPQTASNVGYGAAFTAFGKIRDYCTTPSHMAGMTVRMLYTALVQAVLAQVTDGSNAMHWQSVQTCASRLTGAGVKEEEQAKLKPLAKVAVALSHLGQCKYHEAALMFAQLSSEYGQHTPVHDLDYSNAIASGNDVAIYGGLCALATFNRDELMSEILGGPFRALIDLEPQMRKAVSLQTTAKYQSSLALLQRHHSEWTLDVFLAPHLQELFNLIRQRSLISYCTSYSQINLSALASAFPATISSDQSPTDALKAELIPLIQSGELNARLDLINDTLVSPTSDARTSVHQEARQTAADIERELRLRLHMINMGIADLIIPNTDVQRGSRSGMSSGFAVPVGYNGMDMRDVEVE